MSNTNRPASPFFRPHTPENVVQEVRIKTTPGGTRHRLVTKRVGEGETEGTIKEAKSGIMGCAANLINAIVGAGIVGIPYAVSKAGLWAGIGLIVVSAILTTKSLRVLITTAKHAHTATYETVAEAAFGVFGFRFIAANMFNMAYGAMLTYLMIMKDTLPMLLGIHDMPQRRAILWLAATTIALPLSCRRDVANLAWTSRAAVILDSLMVIVVAYLAPVGWDNLTEKLASAPAFRPDTVFIGLGVLSFAYVCQHSSFLIAGSLERPTIARWDMVTGCALIICCALALTCGTTGYLGYGDDVKGNILNNLPDNGIASAARAALGTTMLFVYPMESFVTRHVCIALFFHGRRAHEGNADSEILNRADRRIGLTVALFLSAIIPASLCENVGSVLAITGAISGSSLSYIGPGAIYLAIHGQRFLDLVQDSYALGAWYRFWYGSAHKKPIETVQRHNNNDDNANRPREEHPLLDVEQPTKSYSSSTSDPSLDSLSAGVEPEERATTWFHFVVIASQTCLAVVSGMPVWCWIASYGQDRLREHMHSQALKSPMPLRIGDVEYRRTGSNTTISSSLRKVDFSKVEPSSFGYGSRNNSSRNNSNSASSKSLEQQIAQQILKQQKQERVFTTDEIMEPDPQANPTWWDFLQAIVLFMFGVVALVAGLWSLAVQH